MARFINFPNRFLLVFSLCDPSLSPSVARGINAPLECYRDKADLCDGQEGMPAHFPSNSALTNVGNSCLGEKNSPGDKTAVRAPCSCSWMTCDTETMTEACRQHSAKVKMLEPPCSKLCVSGLPGGLSLPSSGFRPLAVFLNRPMRETLWGKIKYFSELPSDGKEISKNGSKELVLLQAQD